MWRQDCDWTSDAAASLTEEKNEWVDRSNLYTWHPTLSNFRLKLYSWQEGAMKEEDKGGSGLRGVCRKLKKC